MSWREKNIKTEEQGGEVEVEAGNSKSETPATSSLVPLPGDLEWEVMIYSRLVSGFQTPATSSLVPLPGD
ncbi:hypothetical protein J6590_024813 [Homalodisca vitripennis]|nr:hypothetical protein J6590_024813 [Homalodisca vitripennis]